MNLGFVQSAVAAVALLGFASTADAAYILKAAPGTIEVGETTVVTLNGDTTFFDVELDTTTGIIGGQIKFNFDPAILAYVGSSALLSIPLQVAGGAIDFVDTSTLGQIFVAFSISSPVIAIDNPDDILSVSFTGLAEASGGTFVSVSGVDGSFIQFETSFLPTASAFPSVSALVDPIGPGAFDVTSPVDASVEILVIGGDVPVPVPATLALFGAALAGLGYARRRAA